MNRNATLFFTFCVAIATLWLRGHLDPQDTAGEVSSDGTTENQPSLGRCSEHANAPSSETNLAPNNPSSVHVAAGASPRQELSDLLHAPHGLFYTIADQAREVASSPSLLQGLLELLDSPPTQGASGRDHNIRERIRGIDVMEAIASSPDIGGFVSDVATSSLVRLIRRAVPEHEDFDLRQAVLADKHDALVALTHVNAALSVELYREFLPGPQRDFMGIALLLGFVDIGLERTEAQQYILGLP